MLPAPDAHAQAAPGEHVIGWQLDRGQRDALLRQFPPAYPQPDADHVTLRGQVAADAALPCETAGEIVGRSDDGRGVEVMVVRIGGTTRRPDGGTYHITWSLGPGREARESNTVIAAGGWHPVEPPVAVRLRGARFP